MAKLRQITETTAVPTKPGTAPGTKPTPTKPRPRPETKPWNPPKPKEDPSPKAASTETPTKPGTVPTPTKPRPKPDIKPWNPPRPKEDPAPKARAKAFFLREAYEDEVNPSTRRFWGDIRRSPHTFGKHPILAMYGEESARKAFDDNIERISRAFPEFNDLPPRQRLHKIYQASTRIFMQLSQIESRFRPQLEQIAKEVVSETYGIPIEAMIAQLGNDAAINFEQGRRGSGQRGTGQQGQRQSRGRVEVDPEGGEPEGQDVSKQINKRITMNLLTQGAAVHNMMTIYHLAQQKLNSLEPRLLEQYKRLAPGMMSMYWLMDFIAMADMLGGAIAGSVRVIYDQENDGDDDHDADEFSKLFDDDKAEESEERFEGESDQDNVEYDGPKIKAVGSNFPILIQELVKGVMEVLSHHGLADLDETTTRRVLQASDVMTDEPWLIQIGPHIWRSFLKIVPKGSDLAMIIAKLATKDPDFIHDLLSKTIEEVHANRDPLAQRQALQDMIDEIEDYTGSDIDDLG